MKIYENTRGLRVALAALVHRNVTWGIAILNHPSSVSGTELVCRRFILIPGCLPWRALSVGLIRWALDVGCCLPASLRRTEALPAVFWNWQMALGEPQMPGLSLWVSFSWILTVWSSLSLLIPHWFSVGPSSPSILSACWVFVVGGLVWTTPFATYWSGCLSSFCLGELGPLAFLSASVSSSVKWVLVKKLVIIQADVY